MLKACFWGKAIVQVFFAKTEDPCKLAAESIFPDFLDTMN